MKLRKIFIATYACLCTFELVAMNDVANQILQKLLSVPPNKVGTTIGDVIETTNDIGCKLNDQAVSLSKHLRLSGHFGRHPSILRDFGKGVKETMLSTARINPSLFNVDAEPVSADIADSVTREIFNLLFRTEKASFFVPSTTTGGNRIILKTKLEGHTIKNLKSCAGLYSPDQDSDTTPKVPTNIFEICIRVQKQFVLPDGRLVPYRGSKDSPHAQTIVISIYPADPSDRDGLELSPVSK